MPRFYFDLCNGGGFFPDEEGVELDGLEQAHAFAVESARDVIAADVRDGQDIDFGHFIAVRAAGGEEIERVEFGHVMRVAR